MSSLTVQYILDRIPSEILRPLLATDDNEDYKIEQIEQVIADADAEVDNTLAQVYEYPYIKTNEILGEKSLTLITRWKFIIAKQIFYSYKFDNEEMIEVNSHYRAVLSRLYSIKEGEEELAGLQKLPTSSPYRIKVSTGKQTFTRRRLKSYDN